MAERNKLLTGDRPSQHGLLLGEILAALANAGRAADPSIPDECATCAFRTGTLANLSAGTGLVAFHCAIGTDPSPFGCHHALKDGAPIRLCSGYVAAKLAPFDLTKRLVGQLSAALGQLPSENDDAVREAFDEWAESLPASADIYQAGRAFERTKT